MVLLFDVFSQIDLEIQYFTTAFIAGKFMSICAMNARWPYAIPCVSYLSPWIFSFLVPGSVEYNRLQTNLLTE